MMVSHATYTMYYETQKTHTSKPLTKKTKTKQTYNSKSATLVRSWTRRLTRLVWVLALVPT